MPLKIKFNWVENTDRVKPLGKSAIKNYKTALNKIAYAEFRDEDGNPFHIDTIEKLLAFPDEVIAEIESLTVNNQKIQACGAIMYELGIGRKADGSLPLLTPTTLKYYNAYQKTKLGADGKPFSQKPFDSFEKYLEQRQIRADD
jgi:hypothetical protein